MFTDAQKGSVWNAVRQRGLRAFAEILRPEVFTAAGVMAGASGGRINLADSPLGMVNLVWLAIASAVHRTHDFAGVLGLVLKIMADSGQPVRGAAHGPKTPGRVRRPHGRRGRGTRPGHRRALHDPHGQNPTTLSEEGFVKARRRMPAEFWITLVMILGDRFQAEHQPWVLWKDYRLLALDGTCVNLPHWKRLADHFGTAANGKGGRTTQARLVMLQLPLVRLPWRYELGPLRDGERTIAGRLLGQVRRGDLVLMDRGFWSYGLFWQVQQQQAFFAIRLMRGVRFRTLRRLGPRDRLVRWKPSSRQWTAGGWPSTIDLRIIDYQIPGYRASAVVTNVLDPQRISREEWVRLSTESEAGSRRLAPGLYHRRWEIETTFAELKNRQEMERGLRSRTPEGIAYEIAGHVVLYLLVRWLLVRAAQAQGLDDPLRLSFTGAWRELRDLSQTLITASPARVRRTLLLRHRRIDPHRQPPGSLPTWSPLPKTSGHEDQKKRQGPHRAAQ